MLGQFLNGVVPPPKGAGEFGLIGPAGLIERILGLFVFPVRFFDLGDDFLPSWHVVDPVVLEQTSCHVEHRTSGQHD